VPFVFNLSGAINYYGPFGHMLAVDGFVSAMCSPYATPQTIADNLATYGSAYKQCYSWLGPNQPGVNETDPSDPSACVPDPGGAPPGKTGPTTTACTLNANGTTTPAASKRSNSAGAGTGGTGTDTSTTGTSTTTESPPSTSNPLGGVSQAAGSAAATVTHTLTQLGSTIGSVLSLLGGGGQKSGHSILGNERKATNTHSSSTSTTGQTQSLLNYLMSP
jgi:hypothetical protein